jgi:hypothetical protein
MTLLATMVACGGDVASSITPSATATQQLTAAATRAPTATVGAVAETTRAPGAWTAFGSDAHAYDIEYPNGWSVTSGAEDDNFLPEPYDGSQVLVEFGPRADGPANGAALAATAIEAIHGHYHATAHAVGVFNLGSREALLLEWQTGAGHNGTYGLQAWVPNGDRSWFITMTTPADTRDKYQETFRQMLDSFRAKE